MLTGVPNVYLNYGQKNQQALKKLTFKEAQDYYSEYQFPPGSMGPKILAAIQFMKKNPKGRVIITEFRLLKKALKGKAGTIITK